MIAASTPFFVRWEYGGYVGNKYRRNLSAFGRVIAIGYEPSVFMLLIENERSGMLTKRAHTDVQILDEADYRRMSSAQVRRRARKAKSK